jgi:hypothetical protein
VRRPSHRVACRRGPEVGLALPRVQTIAAGVPDGERAAAILYGDENWGKPLEVADHLGSPKLAPNDHYLILINTVKLEHRLRSIHADTNGNIH